jgi:putative DNA primase/helicase
MNTITPRDIADRLSLKKYPRSWRGDCPSCGYARSFALKATRTGSASVFCSNGCERESLTETVQKVMGGELSPSRPRYDETTVNSKASRQEAALRLWGSALPLDRPAAAPGVAYLRARGIEYLAGSSALRFRSDTRHPEGGALAALIALVSDTDGKPVAAHRTYLTRDGSAKARVTPQKASLGPVWGGAVRLVAASEAFPLVIGEGIESSAAAGLLMGLPAWAALSAGNLAAGLVLPPEVRRIVIAADHDLPVKTGARPGQDAAEAAARRWRREGRRVEIATPNTPGHDFADVIIGHPHGR